MKYLATFWEDDITCITEAEFEANSEKELIEKCDKYVDSVLIPQGYEPAGVKWREIGEGL